MRRLSHVVATVTSVAVMSLLAGCGGDNPAPSAEPSEPSAATKAAPAADPPSLPLQATRNTKAGAAAFVRHWVSVLNYAGETGDTAELRSLSTRDCVRCAALWEGINGVYQAGGRIEGGGWTVLGTKQYGPTQNRYFVDAFIRSGPQTLRSSSDAEAQRLPGVDRRLRAFVLKRVAVGWRVAELDPTA